MTIRSVLGSIAVLLVVAVLSGCATAHKVGFADTVNVAEVWVGTSLGCPEVVLAKLPASIGERARIYAHGMGFFHQNSGSLHTATLHVRLLDPTGRIVAVGNQGMIAVSGNTDDSASVAGVLYAGDDVDGVNHGAGSPFVADPGDYTLELVFVPAGSPCLSPSQMLWISLSYILANP